MTGWRVCGRRGLAGRDGDGDGDVLAVFEGDDGAGEPPGDRGVGAGYGGEEELPSPGQAGHGGPGAAGPGVGEGQAAWFGMFGGGAGRQDGPPGVAGLGGESGLGRSGEDNSELP